MSNSPKKSRKDIKIKEEPMEFVDSEDDDESEQNQSYSVKNSRDVLDESSRSLNMSIRSNQGLVSVMGNI